jgi:Ras-related C3 botulinum toxin substrate 1
MVRKKTLKNSVNVGDSGVGKTCVLISYVDNEFPSEHVPTAFDNYTTIIDFKEKQYTLNLWDTSGQDNDTMRPLSYQDSVNFTLIKKKVVIIFFSLVDRKSFERVEKFWVPEIIKSNKNLPYIIVGNKLDLRDDEKTIESLKIKPVTKEEGISMTKKVGGLCCMFFLLTFR